MPAMARVVAVVSLLLAPLAAQNCAGTSTGRVPVTELGAALYQGFAGGLYGGGQNAPPAAQRALGLAAAAAVQPRDLQGQPDANGRVVLLSIGMSNCTQEFSAFVPLSNADPNRSGSVVAVDGAQGGQTAAIIQNPAANFWSVVDQRLAAASVSAQQVAAVWLKEADANPSAAFPGHAQLLQQELAQVARNLKAKYPNVALCFLSSRIYAGYATSGLNPEPFAYETAFAVQWLIGQQAGGDPQLNADPAAGAVVAPVLLWGPYPWADGLTPRQADGLTWLCSDYQADGTHPGTTGRAKVAAMLQGFFGASEFTVPWYLGPNQNAAFDGYGAGCPGSAGEPRLANNGLPVLGNAGFRIGVADAAATRLAVLLASAAMANLPFGGGCMLLVDPTQALGAFAGVTGGNGRLILQWPVPNDPQLLGAVLWLQWGIDDPAGAPLPGLAGLAMSRGARLRLGL